MNDRRQNWAARQSQQGLVRVTVYVPEVFRGLLIRFAERLRRRQGDPHD